MGGCGWRHCNYSYKFQVQVSYRFDIDPGPGPELDNILGVYILSKKFIIAPKHNKHVVKREEPSPDSRTGGYCKMVPIGRNDLKFFIQGAFAHLY